MNLGDKADRFIRTLRERYRALETQRKAIRNVMDDRKSEYNGLRERESKLRSDVAIATSSQNVNKPQETRTHSNADRY